MTLTTPAPPPLPDELERLARRLRLPYLRKAAPEVLATARAQRWDPAEVIRVLLIEEAAGVNVSQAARDNAKRLATEIRTELNKPLYPFHKKGRYRDFAPRPLNIYDGII